MRCFEVTINDKSVGVIGHADAQALLAMDARGDLAGGSQKVSMVHRQRL